MSASTVAEEVAMHRSSTRAGMSALEVVLNAAATVQAVWFYLAYVRCYVDLAKYEAGVAHTPYQYRLLLMLPLRWAHGSALCAAVAGGLTHLHAWFPTGVRPESLVELPIDVAAVAVAGLVTRRISLALLMVVGTYALVTVFRLRFVYDLPSLGFFAGGMFLLYFRQPLWQFALLFTVATLNRETTLFLLVLFVLSRLRVRTLPWWRRLSMGDGVFAASLLAIWCTWHVWVGHRFAANGTESWSRVLLNLKVLLVPASWLQLGSCFAFCGPLVLLWRRRVQDSLLRMWLWVVPLWFLFMLQYGQLLESRVFGELIPLVACCMALGAEEALLERLRYGADAPGWV